MIFDMKMGQNTPEELADKENIRELVEWERYCRDYEHWDQMRACYHDDATVCTSWTTANIDDFVEGSKKRASIPPRHKIFNTIVWPIIQFSSTVILLKRLKDWNTMPTFAL